MTQSTIESFSTKKAKYIKQRNLMKTQLSQFGTTNTKKGPGRVHRNGVDKAEQKRRILAKEIRELMAAQVKEYQPMHSDNLSEIIGTNPCTEVVLPEDHVVEPDMRSTEGL